MISKYKDVCIMVERIERDPGIEPGGAFIAGTGIPVEKVLNLLGEGCYYQEIIQDYYPQLQTEDISACVRYILDEQ